MRPTRIAALSAFALLTFASGCTQTIGTGSSIEKGPVGIGPTIKELKGTPCACQEIPMHFDADTLGEG